MMQPVLKLSMVESFKDSCPGDVAEVPHKVEKKKKNLQRANRLLPISCVSSWGIHSHEILNDQANNYGNNISPVSEDNPTLIPGFDGFGRWDIHVVPYKVLFLCLSVYIYWFGPVFNHESDNDR